MSPRGRACLMASGCPMLIQTDGSAISVFGRRQAIESVSSVLVVVADWLTARHTRNIGLKAPDSVLH